MKKLIKPFLIIILLTTTLLSNQNLPTKSVVKVFATVSAANYLYPWQTSKIQKYTGSGAIIDGNQILTSAHVVAGAKVIEITKENDPKKYLANIKYISHQSDLALLEVENKTFFKDTVQLKLSKSTQVRDSITVIGYPIGGQNVSTTTGVISRIEQQYYVYSAEKLLAIQIDAAVNSGNSGGPALNDKNELVGIVMMSRKQASNIAYIVPTDIINTFLEDVKDDRVDGFQKESTFFSKIENKTLKKYYGLQNENGILLSSLDKYNDTLKLNDILISIDGKDIANDGTIDSHYGRVSYNHIYHTKQIGDSVNLEVLRDKKHINVTQTIQKAPTLVNYEFSKEPRYIIYGGLVFAPITKNYLYKISKNESEHINKKLYAKNRTENYQESITMIGTSFPHQSNRGYSNWASILKSINGIEIKNFNHLVDTLDSIQNQYTKFEFFESATIILDTQEAKASFEDIKQIYRLDSDRSIK